MIKNYCNLCILSGSSQSCKKIVSSRNDKGFYWFYTILFDGSSAGTVFIGMRRLYHRATGNNSICKKLQSIIADTLVKNLDNPEYMDVIIDGKESLEDTFAEIYQGRKS